MYWEPSIQKLFSPSTTSLFFFANIYPTHTHIHLLNTEEYVLRGVYKIGLKIIAKHSPTKLTSQSISHSYPTTNLSSNENVRGSKTKTINKKQQQQKQNLPSHYFAIGHGNPKLKTAVWTTIETKLFIIHKSNNNNEK